MTWESAPLIDSDAHVLIVMAFERYYYVSQLYNRRRLIHIGHTFTLM